MANRLAQSQSLYLRKHADNPIDWWPWCHEALTKARQEINPSFSPLGIPAVIGVRSWKGKRSPSQGLQRS